METLAHSNHYLLCIISSWLPYTFVHHFLHLRPNSLLANNQIIIGQTSISSLHQICAEHNLWYWNVLLMSICSTYYSCFRGENTWQKILRQTFFVCLCTFRFLILHMRNTFTQIKDEENNIIFFIPLLALQIFQACHVCQQQPRLFTTHGSQIHTLIVRFLCTWQD